MGRLHGNMRGYPAHVGDERTVFTPQGNNRTNLWNSQRESWIQIYPDVWQSANEDEGRADLCVHEFKETGND